MPGYQPDAVQSTLGGTIIYIAIADDFGFCHSDCHEEGGRENNVVYGLPQ